ncbi:LOW QUALITY PROTEIN: vitamin K-dependent protein Z-like [Anabas testudineus]|uniref:LOW QUALITY PROTEIN: vitamin K-dependent protein Z-like n=1 Tax=Anabas testudineus TaxID=64144 RepID=UPI000E45EE1F|nr:LOW QUALITY PROTEIN: vitamin K-dependent protein Z-like [Anabas testudineus]
MAVSIMSACCRASVLYLYLLACFLQAHSQRQVFRQAPQAHNVLLRSKRANTFLLEELLQGNLERECYEERCNFEEAREYFEDTKKTIDFWTVYIDGDQCQPNPCFHGGNCTDMVGGFHCSCSAPYFGSVCELGGVKNIESRPSSASQIIVPEMKKCPTEGPAACQQLCTASYYSFTCSCLAGFKLQSDKRSCLPEVEFPCGRLPDKFNSSASMCHNGNCPWQVSLLSSKGVELCGGVVLGRRSILTAAHCLLLDSEPDLRPSNFFVVASNHNSVIPVQALYVHDRFRTSHHEYDLALLELAAPLVMGPTLIHLCLPTRDFSENILMHSGRTGIVEQQNEGQDQDLVYMTLEECRSQLNVSHPLSNKMCMMKQETQGNPDGLTGNQKGAQDRSHRPLKNRNEAHRRDHHRVHRLRGSSGNHNGAKRWKMMDEHMENKTSQIGAQGTPNGAENHNSSIQEPSEDGSRPCDGVLAGAPVATVEQGTAYLTGLMISSSGGCDGSGLVFTKLSRYLSWIKPRVEVAEDHMTPQISEYPEHY